MHSDTSYPNSCCLEKHKRLTESCRSLQLDTFRTILTCFLMKVSHTQFDASLKDEIDTAYVLAFSLIMLNTDAHSHHIKVKMTKEEFVKNNRGISAGNNLPKEYLEKLYDKIVENEIKMESQSSLFGNAEKKGWCKKQGGRIKTWKKRWLVLKDNCLYYFKKEDVTFSFCLFILLTLNDMILFLVVHFQ
jgi:hypothetical protein